MSADSQTTTTTTTTTPTTPIPECGDWSSWSCSCCGGCSTQRCTRTCQEATAQCPEPKCSGDAQKDDPTSCTSPSETCKFPLPVCCDGQEAYVNTKAEPVAKWCKAS
uniref:Uncharacterized protein n=1 Tax=Panagrolaimus davidi TaxID=227884 RepID=A0A914RC82_9BILA